MEKNNYIVSSNLSKSVAIFVRKNSKIKNLIYYTTKKLYTLMDFAVLANEKLGSVYLDDKKMQYKRINNFLDVGAVMTLNNTDVAAKVITDWNTYRDDIIIIPAPVIKSFIIENGNVEATDIIVDCVIVTIRHYKDFSVMIGDFVTYLIN